MTNLPVLNEIVIGDRKWRLSPLKGKRARLMIPRIASVASRVLYAAIKGGVDTGQLLAFFDLDVGEEDFQFSDIPLEELLKAVHFIIENITEEQLDFLNDEVLPFLLQINLKDEEFAKWWDEEAEPFESYAMTYKAIKYHLSTTFGEATREAIKKSLTGEKEKEPDDDSG